MKRFLLTTACLLITLLLAATTVKETLAQGCYSYGSPNRYYGNYGSYYGGFQGGYNVGYGTYPGYGVYPGYGALPFSTNYRGGHAHWHDTTHLDYHPGEVVRHRNHYHYVPGHYDVHEDGHWDYHD
jgi:hypothetical protein